MPYIVNFTDKDNKAPITVFDNTSNTDTSLVLPGRNVAGYGQIIAENFIGILENFASNSAPVNPVEGQLWYDTEDNVLKLYDGILWKAASNIQKSPTEPSVDESNIGELWVDTTNQQLRIYTGNRWILVGPVESTIDGLRYGPVVENIVDSDNINRPILIFYLADIPVIIVSKDTFTPKIIIDGYDLIRTGINITSNAIEGLFSKLHGTSVSAENLIVSGVSIPAGRFLRSDTINTVDNSFNIRGTGGLTLGVDGTFNLSTTSTAAKIYNSTSGSSIDLQTNRDGIPSTILRILDDNVGINKAVPEEALDVDGNIRTSGSIILTNTTESSNFNNGSFRTAGGAAITKNLLVGSDLDVSGITQTRNIQPKETDTFECGTAARRWNTVRARTIIADTIQGVLDGNISGNANTATNLKNVTTFQLAGDVVSPAIQFDGQVGSYTKIFNTILTSNIIVSKPEPFPNFSSKEDEILVYRPSQGLLKQKRDVFISDLGVPIGAILPFAGINVPYGYLLCDGSEIEKVKYPDLYDIIGNTYGVAVLGFDSFKLPDLRGRFALGRDNMDNGLTVPNLTGGIVDAGGGDTNRVDDVNADILGGSAGQSDVVLDLSNIPEHQHTLNVGGIQYAAVRVDTAINVPGKTGLGPTAPGQAQYLEDSGNVRKPSLDFSLSAPVGIMNPYLTINYIIRSGPPRF
jgi:microcystin-dependent protein